MADTFIEKRKANWKRLEELVARSRTSRGLRSLSREDEVEEERRLAFVGITRAKEECYLSHARLREFRGSTMYAIPSTFLDELPPDATEHVDLSDAALYLVAREAQGSMRDAESLLDRLIALGSRGASGESVAIGDEAVSEVLGVAERKTLHDLADAIRQVGAGGRYLSPGVADTVISDYLQEKKPPDALHQLSARERHVLQTVSVDLEIGVPGTAVFASDKVADTIDYEQVVLRIKALAASGHFRLVETFADRIARILIDELGAPWAKVSAAKLGILANTRYVGVTIERKR